MRITQCISNLIDDSNLLIVSMIFLEISLQSTSFNILFLYTKSVTINLNQPLIANNTRMIESLALFKLTLQCITKQHTLTVFFL